MFKQLGTPALTDGWQTLASNPQISVKVERERIVKAHTAADGVFLTWPVAGRRKAAA